MGRVVDIAPLPSDETEVVVPEQDELEVLKQMVKTVLTV